MPLSHDDMERIAGPHATVSDRIRALAAAGAARAEIARFLGKRYQHVRNVLEDDAQRGGYQLGRVDLSGLREEPVRSDRADESDFIEERGSGAFWLRVRPDGSVYLPASAVEALGAQPGNRIFAELVEGRLTIISREQAIEQARQIVRRYLPPGADLVESLRDDRAREAEDGERFIR